MNNDVIFLGAQPLRCLARTCIFRPHNENSDMTDDSNIKEKQILRGLPSYKKSLKLLNYIQIYVSDTFFVCIIFSLR